MERTCKMKDHRVIEVPTRDPRVTLLRCQTCDSRRRILRQAGLRVFTARVPVTAGDVVYYSDVTDEAWPRWKAPLVEPLADEPGMN